MLDSQRNCNRVQRRGGLRTAQASMGCSTGRNSSALQTLPFLLRLWTLRNWRDSKDKLLLRKDRSRTPKLSGRGRGIGPRAMPHSQQLALPAPASSSSAPVSKSRGKKVIDKTKTWQFKDLLRGPREVKDMFHGGRDNSHLFQFPGRLVCGGCPVQKRASLHRLWWFQTVQRVPVPPTEDPELALRSILTAC